MTGLQHTDFPRTLLSFHLLTSAQLDELARHYHQVWPPVPATFYYPMRIPAWVAQVDGQMQPGRVDLETKRRRFGRFIGLRGCESPVLDEGKGKGWDGGFGRGGEGEEEVEMLKRRVEAEW